MSAREHLVVILASVAVTAALTWPLANNPASLGRSDSGDARHGIWNVAWVAHALTTQPTRLFDANIFDPLPNTLAYSEANLIAGAMAVPVWLATGNPYLAINLVSIAAFVLAAWMTYRLVRDLTASHTGAAFAALAFAFSPFVFSHFAHIQLLMTFGLPWVLLRLHRFAGAPAMRTAAWLGIAMGITGLACGYYGIFAGLSAGFGVAWFGLTTPRGRDWRYWALGLGAAALSIAMVAPFFMPYLAIRAEGFARTLDDARLHSADVAAYLASPMRLHASLLARLDGWREVLFPGFLAIGFSTVAIVTAVRARVGRRAASDADASVAPAPLVIAFYTALLVLSLWASFGPDAGLYTLFYEWLPVFTLVRAPARLGIVVMLALAVLSGVGVSWLERRLPASRRAIVAVALIGVALAGSVVGSMNLVLAPPVPAAYRRLAGLPRAPVVEFPMYVAALERSRQTEYMLMSIQHWQPLVGGYSDHIPPRAFADMVDLATFPDPPAWTQLRDHGARYVVIHWRSFDSADADRLRARAAEWQPRLRLIVDEDGVALYEVVTR